MTGEYFVFYKVYVNSYRQGTGINTLSCDEHNKLKSIETNDPIQFIKENITLFCNENIIIDSICLYKGDDFIDFMIDEEISESIRIIIKQYKDLV